MNRLNLNPTPNPKPNPRLPHDPLPWWHHPMMWLVVGGPALVVVAAVATAVIAVRGADTVLSREEVSDRASAPAIQARNHAASPSLPTQP